MIEDLTLIPGDLYIIGDIHGCYDELVELLHEIPPAGTLAYVGDFTDRGPKNKEVLNLVEGQIAEGKAYAVKGNHCWKLYRKSNLNRNVKVIHGLAETLAQVTPEDTDFLGELPHRLTFMSDDYPDERVTVVHGAIRLSDIGKEDKKSVQAFCIYGETDGTKTPEGFPTRTHEWTKTWTDPHHICVHGHTPVDEITQRGQTFNIDTGCVFGGKLTAFNPFTRTRIEVPAKRTYHQR